MSCNETKFGSPWYLTASALWELLPDEEAEAKSKLLNTDLVEKKFLDELPGVYDRSTISDPNIFFVFMDELVTWVQMNLSCIFFTEEEYARNFQARIDQDFDFELRLTAEEELGLLHQDATAADDESEVSEDSLDFEEDSSEPNIMALGLSDQDGLGLKPELCRKLVLGGILGLPALLARTRSELLRVKGIGPESTNSIETRLKDHDLHLA